MTTQENFKNLLLEEHEGFSYSGRAMYGKRCLAISVENNMVGLVAEIIGQYVSEHGDLTMLELVKIFRKSKEDSLGRGMVLYFPEIEYEENEKDFEEDKDE